MEDAKYKIKVNGSDLPTQVISNCRKIEFGIKYKHIMWKKTYLHHKTCILHNTRKPNYIFQIIEVSKNHTILNIGPIALFSIPRPLLFNGNFKSGTLFFKLI